MSLTNIVYTPVDTGTAKVSPNVDNTKVKDFYLLTGKEASIGVQLRRSVQGSVILIIFSFPASSCQTFLLCSCSSSCPAFDQIVS
jgi:hypothetical protein